MLLIILLCVPFAASVLSWLVKKRTLVLESLAAGASTIELAAALSLAGSVAKSGPYSLTDSFSVDPLGAVVILILAIIGVVAAWYSAGYLRAEVEKSIIGFHRVRQYFVLLHLFIFAMFFAVATTSPTLMWIAIEATTLSTAFLISFYNNASATEAAWKYLLVNSVGLLLGFFGTLLFLSPAESAGLTDWNSLFAAAAGFDPFIAKIAFVFVFIGYGTKVGWVPMHTWRPDAYSKAPIPVVALFSGSLLSVAFLAVLRFKLIADASLGGDFSANMLIGFGLSSIVVAAFSMLGQKNYKRLLAYSSIKHAGIIALGFGFGGAAAGAALLHLIYHALAKSALFLSAGNIFLKYSSTKVENVRGVLSALPVTGVLFLAGFVAIIGLPPFGLFFTELSILAAGIQYHPAVSVIVLLALALGFIGFLRHAVAMMFGEREKRIAPGEAGVWTIVPIIILLAILAAASWYLPVSFRSLLESAVLAY